MVNKINHILKFILLFILIFFFFVQTNRIFAQTDECNTKKECEELLKKYEEEITQYENNIAATQKEKATLNRQISILKDKIKKLELEIKKSNLMIQDIALQIKDTENSINNTSLKIDDYKKQITNILRTIYKQDQKSYVEIFLESDKISDFFNDLVSLESLNIKNQQILNEIKNLKTQLENQKESLENEKEGMEKLVIQRTLQKQESQDTKKEQEKLLEVTKGKESLYQKQLKEAKAKAAEIRNRLFELNSISNTKAPTFGEAYEIAKYVESITGVRPAFLLAVLTQESNIGKNVGQCYLKNAATGAGIIVSSGKAISCVMSPSRDVSPFLTITKELNRDPFNTLVSCPMSFGWGGAMGPAQFIPSTWMKYKDRIKEITGKPADPWDIRDSFLAAGLYLSDYGAKSQTYNDEWSAAMIYFSGSTNKKYSFYGNSVMSIAQRYANDIKQMEGLAIKQ